MDIDCMYYNFVAEPVRGTTSEYGVCLTEQQQHTKSSAKKTFIYSNNSIGLL